MVRTKKTKKRRIRKGGYISHANPYPKITSIVNNTSYPTQSKKSKNSKQTKTTNSKNKQTTNSRKQSFIKSTLSNIF